MPAADQPAAEPRLSGPWWSPSRRLSEEQRGSLMAQLFFEGREWPEFIKRFSALLAFAVLIATFGLAADSSPVVIGAMLVSPLTTPLMGLAAALVLGWHGRALRSLAILVLASLAGAALAALAIFLLPEPRDVTLASQQLLARTQPGMLDLAVALVAGAAGAYVLVRREAIGALPGVAIAVALVPPLASAGMLFELGQPSEALGALLLYLTNLAGIVLAASMTLLLTGVRPRPQRGTPKHSNLGLAASALALVAIAVPVVHGGLRTVGDAQDEHTANRLVREWAGPQDLEVTAVELDAPRIVADVQGPRRPESEAALAQGLARGLDRRIELELRWSRQRVVKLEGSP